MRFFLDTEFIEDDKTIDLISIGIVAEDGREYYAISTEFDESKASDWVKDNVINQLEPRNQAGATFWKPRSHIRLDVLRFIKSGAGDAGGFIDNDHIYQRLNAVELTNKPEIWGWYSATDWVVFYQLFGRLVDKPKDFPHICYDIKQWCDQLGNPQLPKKPTQGRHNALVDARWNKQAWEFLNKYSQDCVVSS
jgi:hypothetical protein